MAARSPQLVLNYLMNGGLVKKTYAAVLLPFLLASCNNPISRAFEKFMAGASGGGSSVWSLSSKTDQMSDEKVVTATNEFRDGGYKADVAVSCKGSKNLSYEITFYDDEDKPARTQVKISDAGRAVPYEVRQDSADAEERYSINPKYNNQIFIGAKRDDAIVEVAYLLAGAVNANPARLAQAGVLKFRIPLATGEMTFEVDQQDASLQQVFSTCSDAIAKDREAVAAKATENLPPETSPPPSNISIESPPVGEPTPEPIQPPTISMHPANDDPVQTGMDDSNHD